MVKSQYKSCCKMLLLLLLLVVGVMGAAPAAGADDKWQWTTAKKPGVSKTTL
jgi:hypothetical protein